MTVYIGLWVIPAMVTILSLGLVIGTADKDTSIGGAIATLMGLLASLVISLVAWLIWALVT